MNEALQTTVDRLPKIMVKNAPSMMKRMTALMQTELAQDQALVNASYCALMLKLSTPDLIQAFDGAMQEAMNAVQASTHESGFLHRGLSLALAPDIVDLDVAGDDFLTATEAFNTLCCHARAQKVEIPLVFGKDIFLNAMQDAFSKSGIQSTELVKIMPFARSALNVELLNLYRKLQAL